MILLPGVTTVPVLMGKCAEYDWDAIGAYEDYVRCTEDSYEKAGTICAVYAEYADLYLK